MGSSTLAVKVVWIIMKCFVSAMCLLCLLPVLAIGRDQRAIEFRSGKIQHPLQPLGTLSPNKPEKHPLDGTVFYRLDDDTVITVVNFYYPSPGPDAFFWVGESGGCDEDSIDNKSYPLAPGKVGTRDYYGADQPILPAYDGHSKDVVLRLPEGVTVKDIKWLCVWCRKFKVNFGSIEFRP